MGKRRKKEDEMAEKEDEPLAVKEEVAPVSEVDELKRRLAEKTELAQAYYAQLQRVQADFENYQKRVAAERERIANNACESIVAGLLDTLDNFDRAMSHLERLPEDDAKGVLMVYRTMLDYLKSNGLERIAAAGCQFDPYRHEAIMQAEVDDTEDGTVLEEFQAGYSMKGKVIRPSKVKVARERRKADGENINNDNNIQKEE